MNLKISSSLKIGIIIFLFSNLAFAASERFHISDALRGPHENLLCLIKNMDCFEHEPPINDPCFLGSEFCRKKPIINKEICDGLPEVCFPHTDCADDINTNTEVCNLPKNLNPIRN